MMPIAFPSLKMVSQIRGASSPLQKNLVAALTRVTGGARSRPAGRTAWRARCGNIEVANPGHVLRQEIDRNGSLERQIVHVVIHDERRITADHIARQGFMPRTTAVHHIHALGPVRYRMQSSM